MTFIYLYSPSHNHSLDDGSTKLSDVVPDSDVVDIEEDINPVKLVDDGVAVTGGLALIVHVSS